MMIPIIPIRLCKTRREKKISKLQDNIKEKIRAMNALPKNETGERFILEKEIAGLEERMNELKLEPR